MYIVCIVHESFIPTHLIMIHTHKKTVNRTSQRQKDIVNTFFNSLVTHSKRRWRGRMDGQTEMTRVSIMLLYLNFPWEGRA